MNLFKRLFGKKQKEENPKEQHPIIIEEKSVEVKFANDGKTDEKKPSKTNNAPTKKTTPKK